MGRGGGEHKQKQNKKPNAQTKQTNPPPKYGLQRFYLDGVSQPIVHEFMFRLEDHGSLTWLNLKIWEKVS